MKSLAILLFAHSPRKLVVNMDINCILEVVKEWYGRDASIVFYSDGSGHISVESDLSPDGEVVVFSFDSLDDILARFFK